MAEFRSFESLTVWQLARKFRNQVYRVSESWPKREMGQGKKGEREKVEKAERGKVEKGVREQGNKEIREKVVKEVVVPYDVILNDFEWEGGVEWIYDYETGFDEGWAV